MSLNQSNLYKIEVNGSISCLQENCSYKFCNSKDKQWCIIQHYKNYHNDIFLKLKVLNAKPYKKPLMQNVITLTEEEQLIQPIYTTKLLVSSIYRYMLLSLKIDTNFKI